MIIARVLHTAIYIMAWPSRMEVLGYKGRRQSV
jgi:hypothetical protein